MANSNRFILTTDEEFGDYDDDLPQPNRSSLLTDPPNVPENDLNSSNNQQPKDDASFIEALNKSFDDYVASEQNFSFDPYSGYGYKKKQILIEKPPVEEKPYIENPPPMINKNLFGLDPIYEQQRKIRNDTRKKDHIYFGFNVNPPTPKKNQENIIHRYKKHKTPVILRRTGTRKTPGILLGNIKRKNYNILQNDPLYESLINGNTRFAAKEWRSTEVDSSNYGTIEFELLSMAFENHFELEKFAFNIDFNNHLNKKPTTPDDEAIIVNEHQKYISQGPYIDIEYGPDLNKNTKIEGLLFDWWYILRYLAYPHEYLDIEDPRYQKICRLVNNPKKTKSEILTEHLEELEIRDKIETPMEQQQRLFGICKWFYDACTWPSKQLQQNRSDVILFDLRSIDDIKNFVSSNENSDKLMDSEKIKIIKFPLFEIYGATYDRSRLINFEYTWDCKKKQVSVSIFD